jgi:hypothetical protein
MYKSSSIKAGKDGGHSRINILKLRTQQYMSWQEVQRESTHITHVKVLKQYFWHTSKKHKNKPNYSHKHSIF